MYEEFFGLTEKPFSIQPDPSFLYWGRTHRLAYAMLEYGVLNHAGISVVTGEVGCGKTTLIHRLLDQLSNTHTVALLSNVQEGRGDLLSWVLMGFGEPFAGKSHVELFAQLQEFFISEYSKGKRVVLIIDEAQNLSMDMLEELRLLSNINAGKDQLLQLILVGQPQLKGLLNRPELLQLAQRVGSDFHLTPLNNEEVRAYIETRLSIAGCDRRLFTNRAMDLVAEQSRGVPRVINVITDTALVYAFSAQELVISVEIVRNVIRDKTDYGVFGIASDEGAAPALPPRSGAGPDAFAGTPQAPSEELDEDDDLPDNKPDGQDGFYSPSQSSDAQDDGHTPDAPEASAFSDHAPHSLAPVTAPVARAVAAHRSSPSEDEAVEATVGVLNRPVLTEESSVTGVVIVGANPKTSPEAAIRAAGDGRAVVFAPIGAAPDALAAARRAGAVVVDGNERMLTTGGRARNAGYRQLKKIAPHIRYVQFVDADCALDPDWIANAEKFMNRRPEVSVVQGLKRTPKGALVQDGSVAGSGKNSAVGEIPVAACASALMRVEAFEAVGGFRGDLPACETEDLCVRQRRRGAHVWRLELDMLTRDPRRSARGGWWKRQARKGYEAAFLASIHGGPPERLGVMNSIGAVFWGFLFPLGVFAMSVMTAAAASVLMPQFNSILVGVAALGAGAAVYAIKLLAALVQRSPWRPSAWGKSFSAVFGRFPQFWGALWFWMGAKR